MSTNNVSRFTEWKGGEQPVSDDTRVSVNLRNGEGQIGVAEDFEWTHLGNGLDILAYRIIAPEEDRKRRVFVPWSGGEQPVPNGTSLIIETRDGYTYTGDAEVFGWRHIGLDSDIVAYAIVGG